MGGAAGAAAGGAEGAAGAALSFEPQRRRLTGLAYRMLGSVAEAEDAVQEAYLRWHGADRGSVADPRAFLSRTVARLCLDRLRSARARREAYVGAWLPEPWLEATRGPWGEPGEEDAAGEAGDVSVALMTALERLSPLERAAFLLHDVFEADFAEIGRALGRTPAACRQLAARARRNLRAPRPRFALAPGEGEAIAEAFFRASRGGDLDALRRILAEDAAVVTDGGGVRNAALNPILGRERAVRLFAGLARKAGGAAPAVLRRGPINGLPGFVTVEPDGALQTTALEIRDGLVAAVYVVRNPHKLAHVAALLAR
jgi:RNA polymerase sigma-70 factor (ECF subfamily)